MDCSKSKNMLSTSLQRNLTTKVFAMKATQLVFLQIDTTRFCICTNSFRSTFEYMEQYHFSLVLLVLSLFCFRLFFCCHKLHRHSATPLYL